MKKLRSISRWIIKIFMIIMVIAHLASPDIGNIYLVALLCLSLGADLGKFSAELNRPPMMLFDVKGMPLGGTTTLKITKTEEGGEV